MIDLLDSKERQDDFYNKVLFKCYAKRYAVEAILGNLEEALTFFDKIYNLEVMMDQRIDAQLRSDRKRIESRLAIREIKQQGDELNRAGDKEAALSKYM